MPICQNCNRKWSYIETFKIPFTLDQRKPCPHCGADQYVTRKTRSRTFFITFLAIVIIFGLNIWLGPSPVNILLAVSIIPIYAIIYPFLVDLANKSDQ